tara:strand:+ start:593 stop:1384 length:792 start_codon:yes stop_codon:yes gene_type:complete
MYLPYKKIYSIICRFYSEILTLLENLFLRIDSRTKYAIDENGFIKINKNSELEISKKKFDFIYKDNQEILYSNKYQKKLILSEDSLKAVIRSIFDRQFCDFLTSKTGFKYTIDFFGAYQNLPIPEKDKNQSWYANHYHLDKPNSKNMLKMFIPMSNIDIENGPLELLDIHQTKKYLYKKRNIDDVEKIYLVGDLGDIFLCKLNLCLHKARIPKEGKTTKLIMLQLNPSRKWYVNSKIYVRQFKREPKFTSLGNKFTDRIPLIL